jgi:hypothetical protein
VCDGGSDFIGIGGSVSGAAPRVDLEGGEGKAGGWEGKVWGRAEKASRHRDGGGKFGAEQFTLRRRRIWELRHRE